MRQRSVMQHDFGKLPLAKIPRSVFNMSSGHKLTFNEGYLIPIWHTIAYPGDTWKMNATAMVRLSTPLFPLMDNMSLYIHFFSCPIRLLQTNFVKMCGEQVNPDDSTDYLAAVVPMPASTGCAESSLFDYLGVPPGVPDFEVVAWYSRFYNKCFNEFFRDENLIDSLVVDTDDGDDDPDDYVLKRVCKKSDYFTRSLPFPQKTNTTDGDVVLPIGTEAPVKGLYSYGGKDGGLYGAYYDQDGVVAGVNPTYGYTSYTNVGFAAATQDATNNHLLDVYADLTSATASTINDLRLAFQLQKMFERDARCGTRYPEVILGHFGVSTPFAGWRVEYLGGSHAPVKITPVPQTSESSGTPQGTLTAYGTCVIRNAGFVKSFTEHQLIMGFIYSKADLTYQQGVERQMTLTDRYSMYWPSLAHLGEQEVYLQEIYAQDPATDTDVDGIPDNLEIFGYQERYAELRHKVSRLSGAMRSTAAAPLDAWHFAQEFGSVPTLSETFIQENAPMDRVLAAGYVDHFIGDIYFDCTAARPMPTYGVPGLIDHF